jgi:hypothetical protein
MAADAMPRQEEVGLMGEPGGPFRKILVTPGLSLAAAAALVIAIGGGAIAARRIGSSAIRDNSIRSRDVRNDTLRRVDLRPGVRRD